MSRSSPPLQRPCGRPQEATKHIRTASLLTAIIATVAIAATPATVVTDGTEFLIGDAPIRGLVRAVDAERRRPPHFALRPRAPRTTSRALELPPFQGGGTGLEGPFSPTINVTLPGARYDYSAYHVPVGVTVTYEGDSEIWSTGSVTIGGVVRGEGRLAVHCSGAFALLGEAGAAAPGLSASRDVTIDVGGSLTSNSLDSDFPRSGVASDTGDVTLISHGTDGTDPDSGSVSIGGGCRVFGDHARILASSSIRVHRFGEIVATRVSATCAGSMRIEDYARVLSDGRIELAAGDGILIRSSGVDGDSVSANSGSGPLTVDDRGGLFADHQLALQGQGNIYIANSARLHGGSALRIDTQGSVNVDVSDLTAGAGGIQIVGQQGVAFLQVNATTTRRGPLTLHSAGGAVDIGPYSEIDAAGPVDVRAALGLTSNGAAEPGAFRPLVEGAAVYLASGGGVNLDVQVFAAKTGSLRLAAAESIVLRGVLVARRAVRVLVTGGSIDAATAVIVTDNTTWRPSGAVFLTSYSIDAPLIDVTGAALVTGSSYLRSGDIVLRTVTLVGADR